MNKNYQSRNLVSCIVTCYDQEQFIEKTLNSVFEQTYQNIELIVADDGSTDQSKETIKSLIDKKRNQLTSVTFLELSHSGLPAQVRNKAIECAGGDFLAFLDGDDLWHPRKIEKQLKFFEDSVVGVGTKKEIIGETRFQAPDNLSSDIIEYNLAKLSREGPVAFSSLIVRNLGIKFKNSQKYKFVEDFEYQCRLISESDGKILEIPEKLVSYRASDFSGGSQIESKKRAFEVLNDYKNVIDGKSYQIGLYRINFSIGMFGLKHGRYDPGDWFYKALQVNDFKRSFKAILGITITKLPRFLQRLILRFYYNIFN